MDTYIDKAHYLLPVIFTAAQGVLAPEGETTSVVLQLLELGFAVTAYLHHMWSQRKVCSRCGD